MYETPATRVKYKGVIFRSTLESNWAEYFDHLNLKWEYEPFRLETDGLEFWLPDFYLPSHNLLVECKYWESLERKAGPNLEKVAGHVVSHKRDVLLALSNGNFVLCSHYD